MGLATHSRSPSKIDTEEESYSSDEDEVLGLHVDHEEYANSSDEAVAPFHLYDSDIRGFFKAVDHPTQFKADEEAASAMGLSLGFTCADSEEDSEDVDMSLGFLEEAEAQPDEDQYKADVEAALSLGLSLGMVGEMEHRPWEIPSIEELFLKLHAEDQCKAEEEAAASLGFSFGIAGDVEYMPEELDRILEEEERLEQIDADLEAEVIAVVFENCWDPYKADEEVADFLGLSLGINADAEHRPEEELYRLDEEEPEDPYKAQEEAAVAMGLGLGLAAARPARVAKATLPSPGTPPKRTLAVKTSAEIEPIQVSKRRRMVEEDVACDKAGKGKEFVHLSGPQTEEVPAH